MAQFIKVASTADLAPGAVKCVDLSERAAFLYDALYAALRGRLGEE